MKISASTKTALLTLLTMAVFIAIAWWASSFFMAPVTLDELTEQSEFTTGACPQADTGKIAADRTGHYFICSDQSKKWEQVLR